MGLGDGVPRATVICTAASCTDWHARGTRDEGFAAAIRHEQLHDHNQQRVAWPDAQVSIIDDVPGESVTERRGRIVREIWVQRAHERGDTRASHLTPWPELDEENRQLDMRIGAALVADERAQQAEAARDSGRDLEAGG